MPANPIELFEATISLIRDLHKDLATALDLAESQYLELHDITNGFFSDDKERDDAGVAYAHLLTPECADGRKNIDPRRCATFMSERFGLPRVLCDIYLIYTHLQLQLYGLVRAANGAPIRGYGTLPAELFELLSNRTAELAQLEAWLIDRGRAARPAEPT